MVDNILKFFRLSCLDILNYKKQLLICHNDSCGSFIYFFYYF